MDKDKIMTFTKTELALALMSQLDFPRQEARKFVSLFFDKISESLRDGESVKLSGIGSFALKDKKTRPGRNPKTKEDVPVTARRVVTFQASLTLKKKITSIWEALNKNALHSKSQKRSMKMAEKHETHRIEALEKELIS